MATPKRGKSIALTAGGILLVLFVLVGILYEPELRSWCAFWLGAGSMCLLPT